MKRDYHEAERFYRKAIELVPKVGLFHANLARCLILQGRRDEGTEEWNKAVELGYKADS